MFINVLQNLYEKRIVVLSKNICIKSQESYDKVNYLQNMRNKWGKKRQEIAIT